MNPVANSGEECFKSALAKARQWCASDERCPLDVKLKLIKLECSPTDINRIIEILTQEGFISEQRYAVAYTSGKFRILKWGKIKIASGLRMKKFSEKIIADALIHIDEEAYRVCLQTLLKKKQKELGRLSSKDLRHKLARFALQKGYEYELVFTILNALKEKIN